MRIWGWNIYKDIFANLGLFVVNMQIAVFQFVMFSH